MFIFQLIYSLLVLALLAYGMNNLVMLFLFLRKYDRKNQIQYEELQNGADLDWPRVTIQVPIFNEMNVIERCLEAVAHLSYPLGRLQIQILDDSNDGTIQLVDDKVAALREGNDQLHIDVLRREQRKGFKAGAMAEAHAHVEGEFIAIFDADFIPPVDFLKKTVRSLSQDSNLAFVQTRWGHFNKSDSRLTKVQSLGIDGHFMVEQTARCWNGLYLNFNGTAGVWRKEAIEDVGGWEWDTLTEDMDLSYRVQLKGWKAEFLPSVQVPAEIPSQLSAFKSQQFRWAKGSIQCAIKILPRVWKKEGFSFRFIEAMFHMTHYVIHPIMVMMALLSWPVLGAWDGVGDFLSVWVFVALCVSMLSTNALYLVSQCKLGQLKELQPLDLPFLMIYGVGMAINNSRAVLEACLGKTSEFVRTPKLGDGAVPHAVWNWEWVRCLEISLGVYCLGLWFQRIQDFNWFSPFVLIYALGFLVVGCGHLFGVSSLRKV